MILKRKINKWLINLIIMLIFKYINIINLFNIRFKIVIINEFDIIIRNIFGYY